MREHLAQEYQSVMLVPGFSESKRFANAFAEEITNSASPFKLADDVDIVLVGNALANPTKYEKAFKERLVITHSAGLLAVGAAAEIIAMNAPEPTSLWQTTKGALQIAMDKEVGAEEGILIVGMLEPIREVLKNPIASMKIPFRIRNFSSAAKLAHGQEKFPGGRHYFSTDEDQFGFNQLHFLNYARKHGVHAHELRGKHNHAFFQPKNMLQQMSETYTNRSI